MKLKYVIDSNHSVVLFDLATDHDQVLKGKSIKSAGFCYINFDSLTDRFEVQCFGKSTTLGIESNPVEDAEFISVIVNMMH